MVVRTKAWLAACLGGQVAGWLASCLLIPCSPSAVSHLLYASDTQKGRERERDGDKERPRGRERGRERERERGPCREAGGFLKAFSVADLLVD